MQTTTFGEHGGIPTYNRIVCRALNEFQWCRDRRVMIMNDTPEIIRPHASELGDLKLSGFSGKRSAFAAAVFRLALTTRVDLTIVGHVNYGPLGKMLRRLQPHSRYGVILYGIDAWQKLEGARARSLRAADFQISISEYTKQKAVEVNGLSRKYIHLLPNALEWINDESSEINMQSLRGTGPRLLSVCRLDQSEQYKGVDKIITVLPEIAKALPDIEYFVVGGGTDLDRHKELARNVGVTNRVHFLGFVSEVDLRACYRNCDLFVLPSAGEGFGFVFLEAMNYGKAIVAADSGGVPEVVLEGVNGCLVNYEDSVQLARSIIDLASNPARLCEMGRAGQERLRQNYTFDSFKKTFHEILQRELPAASLYRNQGELLSAS